MKPSRAIQPPRPNRDATAHSALNIPSALFAPPSPDIASELFVPQHYEPGYAYPLVVWLHGPGADERQLIDIMPYVSLRNYVGVAPRGIRLPTDEIDEPCLGWSQTPEHIQEAEQRVFDSIEAAECKLNIAPRRVFLAGFDCGGTMAFRIAMNHPRRFAGILSIGGAFPSGQTPFGQWAQARNLGVFLAFGRDSIDYPPARACDDLRLLHTAGLSVSLRQYPHGHVITSPILGDMDRWMMGEIAANPSPPARTGTPSPRHLGQAPNVD